MGSIDTTDFVIEIEATFGITIPDADYQPLETAGSLVDYIVRKCPGTKTDEVFKTVKRLVCEHFNIPPSDVFPTSRWVEDLKLD